jgi:hypothetical protein
VPQPRHGVRGLRLSALRRDPTSGRARWCQLLGGIHRTRDGERTRRGSTRLRARRPFYAGRAEVGLQRAIWCRRRVPRRRARPDLQAVRGYARARARRGHARVRLGSARRGR